MLTEKFKQAIPILEHIEKHGYDVYFVGGCVRDLLLEREIKDIDMTSSATPEEIQAIFPSVIPVGIDHGTVIVRCQEESYEITTFRAESDYSDGRHPDQVEFIRNIEKDLERRDFTINALAMDKQGNIIDLFDGKTDLKHRVIRTVGNGVKRFNEDALRIIRALRFSSQLGFQIEAATLHAMITCKEGLYDISVERITKEMEQFFAGSYITNGINYLLETKLSHVLPVLKNHPELIQKLPKEMRPLKNFAEVIALMHHLSPSLSVQYWAREWKCSNRTKQKASALTEALTLFESDGVTDWGMYCLNEELLDGFIRLIEIIKGKKLLRQELLQRKQELAIQSRKELAINGNDLLELFPERDSGPWIKQMLTRAEQAVVNGELPNQYKEIKEWLKWKQPEIN